MPITEQVHNPLTHRTIVRIRYITESQNHSIAESLKVVVTLKVAVTLRQLS